MLQFYHSHLQSNLTKTEFLIFKILIDLLQIHQWVRLESLADKFPLPITAVCEQISHKTRGRGESLHGFWFLSCGLID